MKQIDNSDLAGVRLLEVPSEVPAKITAPGGALYPLSCYAIDGVGGVTMRQLASLKDPAHPLAKVGPAACNRCGAPIEVMRFFSALAVCDPCGEKAAADEAEQKAKTHWEAVCPPAFRDTDLKHAGFPRVQYAELRNYRGEESLWIGGDARLGKTRLALAVMKRCLHFHRKGLAVLWPEDLKQARSLNISRKEWVTQWGRPDLLLLDDCLLTGAQDERITDALKDLIDYRIREKRASIITSQISGEQVKEQAQKFGNPTANDIKRIEALLGRIRETFRVVMINAPGSGESMF